MWKPSRISRVIWPAAFLVSVSCSLVHRRIAAYPTGLIFPVAEVGRIVLESRPGSRLVERNGICYVCTRNGDVLAVDAAKGKVLWTAPVGKELASGPYAGRENIYLLENGKILHALSPDGRALWTENMEDDVLTPVLEEGDWIHFGTTGGALWSLNIVDRTRRPFRTESSVGGGPIVAGDRIICGDDDGNVWFIGPGGKQDGVYRAGSKISLPMATDGKSVFFGTEDKRVHRVSLNNKKRKWKIGLGGRLTANPVVSGGRIYLLSGNGVLYCVKISSGEILWWRNIPSPDAFDLLVAGKVLAVASASPPLLAFDMKTGKKIGEFSVARDILSNPVWIDPDLVCALSGDPLGETKLAVLRKDVGIVLSSQKSSPQPMGEEISFSVKAVGFFKPKYEFAVVNAEGREIVRKETETESWIWYFDAEGSYVVKVKVMDEKQTKETQIPFVIEKKKETEKTADAVPKEKTP